MNSLFRRRRVESPALTVVVVLLLCGSGTALAASSVGSLVTKGEDGAVSARGAQQPLESAVAPLVDTRTPPVDTRTPPVDTATPTGGPGDDATVLGKISGNPGDNAGSGSNLPFTGFLAIPLLILGAGMLLGGVALRRRDPRFA